jgi:hypothetical protein
MTPLEQGITRNHKRRIYPSAVPSCSPPPTLVLLDEDEQSAIIHELEHDYIKHTKNIGWMFLVVCSLAVILSFVIGYEIQQLPISSSLWNKYYEKEEQEFMISSIYSTTTTPTTSIISLFFFYCYIWSCISPLYVALVHVVLGYIAFYKFIAVETKRQFAGWNRHATANVFVAKVMPVLVLVSVMVPAMLVIFLLVFFSTTTMDEIVTTTPQYLLVILGGSNLIMFLFLIYIEKDREKTFKQLQDLNICRYKLKSV